MPESIPPTTASAPVSETVSPEMREARKALRCLYLEVHESIARDVKKKVEAAFAALEAQAKQGVEDSRRLEAMREAILLLSRGCQRGDFLEHELPEKLEKIADASRLTPEGK